MITEQAFLETAQDVFRAELDDDALQISMTSSQADIPAWDSLAHVRVVMRLESEFQIRLEASEIEKINSVRGFYDAIRNQLA